MTSLFKEFVYSYVGMVAWTAEKAQSFVNSMVEEEKISREEGKEIMEGLMQTAEDKKEGFQSQVEKAIEKATKNFRFASASDLDVLKERIATLEEKGAKKAPVRRKTTVAKKTTAKTETAVKK
jgi:polyhydroxyalkanoate synthesis regulator phasin